MLFARTRRRPHIYYLYQLTNHLNLYFRGRFLSFSQSETRIANDSHVSLFGSRRNGFERTFHTLFVLIIKSFGLLVSEKKIFKVSANQNFQWWP